MSAADLDDIGKGVRLLRERALEMAKVRQQPVLDLVHRSDMHRRRKAVVRGLAAVDMVIGMNRRLAAAPAAEHLVGPVCQHLVHVHVGLRAGAGLPDDERELVIELAGDHLLGGGDDGVAKAAIEPTDRHVGERGRLLLESERANERHRHALAADAEVFERALRLRPPIAVRGDGDLSHAVALDTGVACRSHDGLLDSEISPYEIGRGGDRRRVRVRPLVSAPAPLGGGW